MSKRALLIGTIGGIIGAITAAIGVIWPFILDTFFTEIEYNVVFLSNYLTGLFGNYTIGGVKVSYPYPIPYFPSWFLFGVSSFVLSILLIVTGVLIGAGFYGTYKIGGGAAGVVGVISSVGGITGGALLILMVNLTTGYEQTLLGFGGGESVVSIPFSPVPTPNFPFIVIGFLVLGVALIVLGSVSISVRERTKKPSAFYAAGVSSIVAALFFILGSLIAYIRLARIIYINGLGLIGLYLSPGIPFVFVIGFGLIFVAFILWAWVFYSSRNL